MTVTNGPESDTSASAGKVFDVPIEHAVFIRAPAERAYDALTTTEGISSWFTAEASVDLRPGGALVWRWKEWGPDRVTVEAHSVVREADRPRRFVFEHDSPNERRTLVEVTFEPRDDGTVVRLRETGFTDSPRGRRGCLECATGWGEALTLLKFWVEHGLHY